MERSEFGNHISGQLNQNIEDIFNHILEMGGLVEGQLENSMVALGNGDVGKAREIIALDKAVNNAEFQIDRLCARVLARQQPTATDLRLIISAIRIAIDLERMGDEVVKIANMVLLFNNEEEMPCAESPGYEALVNITNRSVNMLRTSLDSFARVSLESAGDMIQEEERVDEIYKTAVEEVKSAMVPGTEKMECLLEILSALRAAERVSDHARNIVESTIFLIQGQDIRDLNKDALIEFLQNIEKED